jgi:hypothetical protein
MNEAQREAIAHLKAEGELDTMIGHKVSPNEIYIHHEGGLRITAVHVSGIVTEHYRNRGQHNV